MTETRSDEQLLAAAVDVLTEAARRTRVVGEGTDQEHRGQADFAEFLTLAVAATAANMGSIESLLAGRPGSWEADSVRNMLISTAGDDEKYLLEHRTEPLRVQVNVADILNELGLWQMYDEAEDELTRRYDALGIPSVSYQPSDPDASAAAAEALAQMQPATDEQEVGAEALEALRGRLEQQREQEWAAYGQAFKANVLAAAAELLPDLRVPVEAVVETTWQNSDGTAEDSWGPAFRLWEKARLDTPLPGSGIPLRDYDPSRPVAEIEREAGRTPLARLENR